MTVQTAGLKHNDGVGCCCAKRVAARFEDIRRAACKHDRAKISYAESVSAETRVGGESRPALEGDPTCVSSSQPVSCARKRDAATNRTRSTRLSRYYDW